MKRVLWRLSLFAVIIALGTDIAEGDRRGYVWTYEYQTMPKGEAEIEYYLTLQIPDQGDSGVNAWKHWLEVEYGINDHWDISMYQQFKQTNKVSSSDFQYDGFKIRSRYRFGEIGHYPLDFLLYFEYIRNDNLSTPNVFEGKLILAKDIKRVNVAYNQILKTEIERHGESEHEYALGVSYEFSPVFKVGLESKGNYTESKYYLGPTVSVATGSFWMSIGGISGLNNKSDDLQVRTLIGIPF